MAKQRLFPEPPKDPDDTRTPHERFSELAAKVVNVPKDKIDKLEKQWQRQHPKP